MSELISHTPVWVFIVFFTLLVLGVIQTKERTIKVKAIFILPLTMFVFSFFGVYSVSGFAILPILLWLSGIIIASLIGLKLKHPRQARYSRQDRKLTIPGSMAPLILMMAIFFTKYFVGFSFARELPLTKELMFLVIISLSYGIFSGIFLSRSLIMFKASKTSA